MQNQGNAAPKARTITCVGFDWRAEVSLKETLALLQGKTLEPWQYSEELIADVVVYEKGNALAQTLERRSAPDSRVFYPSVSEDESQLTLRPPFGASRLVRCLDAASLRLKGQRAAADGAAEISLCQRLDDALRAPGTIAVALRAGNQSGLLKSHEQQLSWSQPLGLDAIADLLSGEVQVQALGLSDATALRRLQTETTHPVAAETLLWAVGLTRSKGALLHRLDAQQPYRLRRWPNFGLLGRRSTDLRCCSLLMQRALTPTHLSMLSGMPLGVIGSFLNACALSGLLEAVDAPALPAPTATPAAADSGIGNMLRRIRLAFAIAE